LEKIDTLIVGAGPAGTICAYLLRNAGVDCILVDRASFPREKLCGGGLTPKAYSLVEEIMPGLQYEYRAVNRVKVGLDHKSIGEIELPQEVRIVSRKDFDYALLRQYLNVGGLFIQDSFVSFARQEDGCIVVTLKSGKQIVCNHLVGADGANSRMRKQVMGRYDGNVLFVEQYIPKGRDAIEGVVSRKYEKGYYYLFPSVNHDVVGLGAKDVSVQEFRDVLAREGIAETTIKGANIPVKDVESGFDDIMLIGDAGGFANKLSYEGLYYAFATGRNAARAIVEGKSFRDTNRDIFKRKRKERLLAGLFYSRFGMFLVRYCSFSKRLVCKIFVAGLSH